MNISGRHRNRNSWEDVFILRVLVILMECLMNGLCVRRPDYSLGVVWVLQYQLAEVQRPVPAAVDLNLAATTVVRMMMLTAQTSMAGGHNPAPLF